MAPRALSMLVLGLGAALGACRGGNPDAVDLTPGTGDDCELGRGVGPDDPCPPACDSPADVCAAAHRSVANLVSSNGFGALAVRSPSGRVSDFFEHVYRAFDASTTTRDLLYAASLGVRSGSHGRWLADLVPSRLEYLDQGGIVHLVHRLGPLRVDTWVYAPFELELPAMVLLGRVTNEGSRRASVSLYTRHDYRLGTTPAHASEPAADGERLSWDAADDAWVETGPGGALVHAALGGSTHHGATPGDAASRLEDGQDLRDGDDSGTGDNRIALLQKDFSLAPGEAGAFGVATAYGREASTPTEALRAAYGGRAPLDVLADARAAWEAWRAAPPAGLSDSERFVYRQAEAVLRMGQVRERCDGCKGFGQIVASLPPGQWNIAWARDGMVAAAALARMGHTSEAAAALRFELGADLDPRLDTYVGVARRISVCRYFGRGLEESDTNSYGPNVELDGFGLFLWALGEHARAGGDPALVDEAWPAVRDQIAGALVALRDPATGLVRADSSIWERHVMGQERRFTYTSVTAARGLCYAATLADGRGEPALAKLWRDACVGLRDALRAHVVTSDLVLGDSYEAVQAGAGYHDGAVADAFGWQLFDPRGAVATATFADLDASLAAAGGFGYFRHAGGDWYDSQEWVFVNLRIAGALRCAGADARADRLVSWITAQSRVNAGLVAELYAPDTGAYEGAVPMVGFGAGAYVLALWDRAVPEAYAPLAGSWESR